MAFTISGTLPPRSGYRSLESPLNPNRFGTLPLIPTPYREVGNPS